MPPRWRVKYAKCVCILALFIWHANRVFTTPYYIVTNVPFGSDLYKWFHKRQNISFPGNNLLNIKRVFQFYLQTSPEKLFFRFKGEFIEMSSWRYAGLHVRYPLFFVRFQSNLSFLDTFPKSTQISSWKKIRPVGDELFSADGRTRRN